MLDPYDRVQLVSELRPPEGFEYDCGIGTTFSVDLQTLLTVPLSLALCEFESRDDALANPEAVLEGLRRIAGKLHIFCHRSRIYSPKEGVLLFSFLEDMVVQALPKNRTGSFHPKVWVLRYRRDAETIVRVLILSRNLTFDKSWDTALVLEGFVQSDRKSEIRKNRKLAQFVRTLPDLSGDISDPVWASLESIALDILRVDFDVPDGFTDLAFWPLGIGTDLPSVLDWNHSRIMVISPFLSDLSATRDDAPLDILLHKRSTAQNILVSRPEQLDILQPDSVTDLQATTKLYVLDDAAVCTEHAVEQLDDNIAARPADTLSGLHAKVYVIENGQQVSILTGSANATRAAWGNGAPSTNVEFMVELMGTRAKVGIDALLGNQTAEIGAGGLLTVLKPYNKPNIPCPINSDLLSLEKKIDLARQQLAAAALGVKIVAETNGDFRAILNIPPIAIPDGIECHAWPVMLSQARKKPIYSGSTKTAISFDELSILAVTPFWTFQLSGKIRKVEQTVAFVLRLSLEGMPEGRTAAIMSSMINSSDRFLRYLALLLSDDPAAPGGGILRSRKRGRRKDSSEAPWNSAIVLESLIYAYSRNPKRLERIEALLKDLKQGGASVNAIPPEFDDIWQAFRQNK